MDKRSAYIGQDAQLFGVEEHRLIGGKGDGMRLLQVRNGLGLEFTLAVDRCADIMRMSLKGDNLGYFSPVGYVAPTYYDHVGTGFLKSFTAGFLTTCGLLAVSGPAVDEGEELPQHGSIANIPAENCSWDSNEEGIRIRATMRHAEMFGPKLRLERSIICSKTKNSLTLTDTVTNEGASESPLMILYHINAGYPLLNESSNLYISADRTYTSEWAETEHPGAQGKCLPPTPDHTGEIWYHKITGQACAGIYNPDIAKGFVLRYDTKELDWMNEWRNFADRDYVLGLEPGNCTIAGRDVERKEGRLKFIKPGEEQSFTVEFDFLEGGGAWKDICE
jgi:hypothetical protein